MIQAIIWMNLDIRYKNVHMFKWQQLETSSYKINTGDVMYNMMTINITAV